MKRLGEEVSRELGRFGVAEEMTRIVEAWPSAVGPTIARNAWPARIARDGTLHVATSSSSWAFELGQLEADVVRRVRKAVGAHAPTRVRFAVGKLPEAGPESRDDAGRTAMPPRAEDVAKAAELASVIEDDELRETVAKAAAQSLFRAGTDRSF